MSTAYYTLGLAITYCFLADRGHLFNKVQKIYSPKDFLVFCTIVLALGTLSIRRSIVSSVHRNDTSSSQHRTDPPFLSRDQTDEWKGWMQFLILIYHYTGASRILWIYKIVRLLVASYLFMTGYGHTVFFCRKADYSLRRHASVLVRLNLLSCILPYIMGTDYLVYYFAPLISFWYVVICITMWIGHAKNTSLRFLLGKIGVSALLVNALIRTDGIFEVVFYILEHTCRIHWNVTEWRFRLQLDSYIVYIGMLAGIIFVQASKDLHTQRFPPRDQMNFVWRHWTRIRIASTGLAIITLPTFWAIARHSRDKYAYNRWMPYISLFPILSYVVLRNCNRIFRNFHSSIFAWLGRCSLETFTLQFHIWLAADTKGLLSLGIVGRKDTHTDGRRFDFVILTSIFLWMSSLVADATGVITSLIIDPSQPRSALQTPERDQLPWTRSPERETKMSDGEGIRIQIAGIVKRVKGQPDLGLGIRLATILMLMWALNMVCETRCGVMSVPALLTFLQSFHFNYFESDCIK